MLFPYLFNLYIEHIRKTGLGSERGVNIGGRNNNLMHADDTMILTKSSNDFKWLLMKVKEESAKTGL